MSALRFLENRSLHRILYHAFRFLSSIFVIFSFSRVCLSVARNFPVSNALHAFPPVPPSCCSRFTSPLPEGILRNFARKAWFFRFLKINYLQTVINVVYCVPLSGCSSVWLECLLGVQEVACSSQVTPTIKKEAFRKASFFRIIEL